MSASAIPDTGNLPVAHIAAAIKIVELAAGDASSHGDPWKLEDYIDAFSRAYDVVNSTVTGGEEYASH